MLSNSLHCIKSICKVVHMVMDVIGMNCCWGRPKGRENPARLVVAMAYYMSESSFTNWLLHFKGEEVCGFAKRSINFPPNIDNDSHHPNRVKFFCPRIIVLAVEPNIMDDVRIQQPPFGPSNLLPLVSRGGPKLNKIFVLMASGILNIAHPILQFNVLHSKKLWWSDAKQRSTFTKWNFYSMLFKFLSTISQWITWTS